MSVADIAPLIDAKKEYAALRSRRFSTFPAANRIQFHKTR